jgi:hypothetical protein
MGWLRASLGGNSKNRTGPFPKKATPYPLDSMELDSTTNSAYPPQVSSQLDSNPVEPRSHSSALFEAVEDPGQPVLHQHEHAKQQQLLDDELHAADEASWDEGEQDQRDPDEILYLIPTNLTQGNPEQPDSGSHAAEETTPG